MTSFSPEYRMTLYALPSQDVTETTVLTPAAGAPHSDPFQITTLANLPGWKPYMQAIRGRRGKIDPSVSRTLDIGSVTVGIIDKTVGTVNANRWVSAFFGDAKGRFRGKHKVLIEESLDSGVTWNPWWTGRLLKRNLTSQAGASFEIRDASDDMQSMMLFVGEPHRSISYAALMSVMPVGLLRSNYGTLTQTNPLSGVTSQQTINGTTWMLGSLVVQLDTTSQARDDNVVTTNLTATCPPNQIIPGGYGPTGMIVGQSLAVFSGRCRARITWTSGALSGQTGDYMVGSLSVTKAKGGKQTLQAFLIQPVDPSDRFYLALPAAGVGCTFYMYLDAQINDKAPLYINDVDPAQLIQDICDGKFSYWYRPPETLPTGKSYGDVKKTIPCANSSSFLNTRPLVRFIIKQAISVIDFLEKHLLPQMNWAIYLNKQGQITIVDLTTPNTLAGLPTIIDADCASQKASWTHDTDNSITRVDFTHYIDQPIQPAQLVPADGSSPSLDSSGVVQEYDAPLIVLNVGTSDFIDTSEQIDADGLRAMQGEQEQGQDRFIFNQNYLANLANQLRMPYGWGAATLPLLCRRTATVTSLTQGSLAILNVSWVPNPTSNTRGGTRVVRVLEVSEDGPNVQLQLLDLGVNATVASPTFGPLALETNNTYTGITFSLTLNGNNDLGECRYAVTPIGTLTIPADGSPLWTFGFLWSSNGPTNGYSMSGYAYASGTTALRMLPPNSRVWVQMRSIPLDRDPHYPSPWVSPASGNAYIDMAALPAPSALSSSLITGHTTRLSFTPGASDLQTLMQISQPTDLDTFTRANNSSSLGTADSGQVWSVTSGTWGISSNQGYHASGTGNHAAVLPGTADGTLQCDVTLSATANRSNAWVIFRQIDDNNYWLVSLSTVVGNNPVRLYKHDSGSWQSVIESASLSISAGGTYTVRVVLAGTSINVFVNGTLYLNYTMTAAEAAKYTTPANVGIGGGFDASNDDGGSRWDNFSWTPSTATKNYATLLPGSNMVDIQDLDLSTTYIATVSHVLGNFKSAYAALTWTTTGSGTTAANVGSVTVVT